MNLIQSLIPGAGKYLRSGIELLPIWLYNFIRDISIENLVPYDGTDYVGIGDFRACRQEK